VAPSRSLADSASCGLHRGHLQRLVVPPSKVVMAGAYPGDSATWRCGGAEARRHFEAVAFLQGAMVVGCRLV
jgi:hypothetical protein